MRYWIYWNDLVQGPFEVDEVVKLHAFTRDLLVCEETRQDWTSVLQVDAFASYVTSIITETPPPPPPNGPFLHTPLQGEFLVDADEQKTLFDLNGSKLYAYRSSTSDIPPNEESLLPSPLTTPFRFGVVLPHPENASLPKELKKDVPPDIEEDRLKPEEFNINGPETQEAPITPEEFLDPHIEKAVEFLEETSPKSLPVFSDSTIPPEEERAGVDVLGNAIFPSAEEQKESPAVIRVEWWPWVVGGLVFLMVIGTGTFWFIDHLSTRSAIEEAVPAPSPKTLVPPPATNPAHLPEAPTIVKPRIAKTNSGILKPTFPVVKKKRISQTITGKSPSLHSSLIAHSVKTSSAPKKSVPATASELTKTAITSGHGQADAQQILEMALQQTICGSKRTVGSNAHLMLEEMHQKELIHAAETGTRLYLPDKLTTTAFYEEGALYRIFLHFMALQANGERVEAHSYQFYMNSETKQISPIDSSTKQDFFDPSGLPAHVHNPKADDIESVLSAANEFNKRKSDVELMKKNHVSKSERKKVKKALQAAEDQFTHTLANFRTKYSEQELRNVEKAYSVNEEPEKTEQSQSTAVISGVGLTNSASISNRPQPNNVQQTAKSVSGLAGTAPALETPQIRSAAGLTASSVSSISRANGAVATAPSSAGSGTSQTLGKGTGLGANAVAVSGQQVQAIAMVPGMLVTNAQGAWGKPANSASVQGHTVGSNPWAGLDQQALEMALQHKIYGGKRTIGSNARLMLEDMHEKELIHAAETGERLYLPDKLSTTALYEEGAFYRIYLNFMAWQANGERVEARSYQLHVNFEKKQVTALDPSTQHDFFDPSGMLIHVHNPKADDIESILSAVDELNKLKLDSMIMKKSHASKDERKKTEDALQVAEDKFTRTIVYFRTKYPERELKNVAKAYEFSPLLKGSLGETKK